MKRQTWRTGLNLVVVLLLVSAGVVCGRTPRVLYKSVFPVAPAKWLIQGKMIYLDDEDGTVELKERTFGNFFSHRCKGFPLKIALGSDSWETTTDSSGNFHVEAVASFAHPASGALEFRFSTSQIATWADGLTWEGVASPSFLVISDVDDTVLVTEVTNRFKMLVKTFFRKPEQRGVVAGTPQVYEALVRGPASDSRGLLVFVSASPMYLAPQLEAFFKHQKFPAATLILREFGVKEKWEDKDEELGDYKMKKITELMTRQASVPVILLGDSGERDPEIYTKIVAAFSGRVKCVVIRNVSGQDEFHERYATLKKQVPLLVWKDPQQLLANLVEEKLITAP